MNCAYQESHRRINSSSRRSAFGKHGWWLVRFSDDRKFYKPGLGIYNTSFLVEDEQAQRLGAEWNSNDRKVATRYIHAENYF